MERIKEMLRFRIEDVARRANTCDERAKEREAEAAMERARAQEFRADIAECKAALAKLEAPDGPPAPDKVDHMDAVRSMVGRS